MNCPHGPAQPRSHVEGGTYRVSDLWNGVFLNSGNDAVHVLASLTGGWRATAARMQAEARALGAFDTHVRSPDGYDAPGQVSSAYDLAVFGRAGLRNPDFARYCAKVDALFPGQDGEAYGIMTTGAHRPPRALRRTRLIGSEGTPAAAKRYRSAPARRTDPGRHRDEPSGGRRPRRLRGGPRTAGLGVRCR
ncbi:hypothetical protein [Streptomyces sp. DHE17-7]|uniref:hypothetical protein n=1 Tax=Streptomyces sp. DHE17-7 TaxID=2759949 RepID=UPI003FA6BF00